MSSKARTGLALVVLALAIGLVSFAATPVRAANESLTLFGSLTGGWGETSTSESQPGPTLTVSQGDTVTITLTSTDGFAHEFLVDYNNNGVADAGEPVSSSFTSTTTLTFVASQAGTFAYMCLFHPTSMHGTFVVQGSGAPPPSNTPTSSGNTLLIVGILVVVVAGVGVAVLVLRRNR